VFVVRVWGAIERGNDTVYYYVLCEGLGMAIWRGTDTECYCFVVRVWECNREKF